MGVNGSGKTTVIHALACLYQPDGNGENHRFPEFFVPNTDIECKKRQYHLHKTSKGKILNNNITTTNKSKKDINIKEIKEEKTINNKEATNKIKEQKTILTNKKVNKGTNVISINTNNIKKNSHNSFPLIKKNRKLTFSQEFLNYKNTHNYMNFNNNLLLNKNENLM